MLAGEHTGEPPIQQSDAVRILRFIQDMEDIPSMRIAMKKRLLLRGKKYIQGQYINKTTG